MIADMATGIEMSRLMVRRAAWELDEGTVRSFIEYGCSPGSQVASRRITHRWLNNSLLTTPWKLPPTLFRFSVVTGT